MQHDRARHRCPPSTRIFLLLVLAGTGTTQVDKPFDISAHYSKAEHRVAMRDGVELFTTVYAPKDRSKKYPIMLFRTPYGTGPHGADRFRTPLGPSPRFQREGFIFVYQDVRGKGLSAGEFVVMQPVLANPETPTDTDETTDTFDAIQWALDHIQGHNGRVGQWGISYPGFQTVMGMIRAHPALVASSPQASPSDMFIGDDFHHNGAFRLMYTFSWLRGNAHVRTEPGERPKRFSYGTRDGYRFFLDIGPVKNIDDMYFHGLRAAARGQGVARRLRVRAEQARRPLQASFRAVRDLLLAVRLEGRRVLLTGASRGIGAALLGALEEKGCDVHAVARTAGARVRSMDVSDPEQVRALRDAIGGVDVLINNAGVIHSPAPLTEIPLDEWERLFSVNVFGLSDSWARRPRFT